MSGDIIVAIISLVAVLILAASALRSQRFSWKTGAGMAVGWIAIFAAITLFVGLLIR